MYWTMLISAGFAAVIHTLFFFMESVWWKKPAVMRIFRQSESDAEITHLLAFNQGFYNLFLALGNAVAIWFVLTKRGGIGYTIMAANCSVMLGAALILLISSPKMIRGVIIQGLPPLIFLVAFMLY